MNAQSESIAALGEALAAAQAVIKNPSKNREVEVRLRDDKGKYKFKYATFDGIIDALREPLTKNGLWFVQSIADGCMVTTITHSSGEWMSSTIPMPNMSGKPQEIGSLITYFKRYSLSAAFGIAVDEDDDANAAEGNEVSFQSRASSQPPRSSAPKHDPVAPDDIEPPEGWGDWTRALIEQVGAADSDPAIDAIKNDAMVKARINATRRVDKAMYKAIGDAFAARRKVLADEVPF